VKLTIFFQLSTGGGKERQAMEEGVRERVKGKEKKKEEKRG
jgi:hypothetical protein